jgi:DNA ligase-associated metallophosphoesterase
MLSTTLAGEPVQLLPCGALHLPRHAALLVADLHVGKAQSFRRLGVPVPESTTLATLDALDAALAATGARRLVVLGDFLHSRRAHAPVVLGALAEWRARHGGLEVVLVRGNHDDRAGDPPADLRIQVVDEPWPLGPFALCHHPQPRAAGYVLAGHWHPCVRLRGRAFDRLRLPCFWFGPDGEAGRAVGVLPAYGSFTGMHPIERSAGERVYALADGAVVEIPG